MEDEHQYYAPGQILVAPGHTYLIVRMLGEGGMGTVYEAIDRDTGNQLAIKVLKWEHVVRRGDILERFRREARFAGQIAKRIKNRSTRAATKYLLKVTAIGELAPHGIPYYAMTYLSGNTVQSLLQNANNQARKLGQKLGLPADAALNIAIGLLFSLEALHQCGVVHRDVKAANIYLHETPGEPTGVVLLDYGIAHLMDEGARATVAGTPGAIAPEHFFGEIGPPADIFAVGVLLFTMLAGVKPASLMSGPTWPERGETRKAPSLAPFGIVPALVDVVAQCLALDPRDRPTAVALYSELQDISNALPPIDVGTAITENDPVARTAPGDVETGISVAEVSPATSPDLELTPRMNALRVENERRARLGLSAVAQLPNHETTPMAGRPVPGAPTAKMIPARQLTVPMGVVHVTPPRPAAADLVTLPPVSSSPSRELAGPSSLPEYAPASAPVIADPIVALLPDRRRLAEELRRAAKQAAAARESATPVDAGAVETAVPVSRTAFARAPRAAGPEPSERSFVEPLLALLRRRPRAHSDGGPREREERELAEKQREVEANRRQRRAAEARGERWTPKSEAPSFWRRWGGAIAVVAALFVGAGSVGAVRGKLVGRRAEPARPEASANVEPAPSSAGPTASSGSTMSAPEIALPVAASSSASAAASSSVAQLASARTTVRLPPRPLRSATPSTTLSAKPRADVPPTINFE